MALPVDVEAEILSETQPLVPKEKKLAADEDKSSKTTPSIREDALETIALGVPIFIARLSWVGMKTTDSALLGHVSREALSAAALSDLWTMCTALLIQAPVLNVLVGGAIGSNNPKLAGIYLQVSYAVLGVIAVLVIVAWNFTKQVWVAFGSDADIASMAGYYARILSFSIPAQCIFSQLSQFFSAQKIMHPEVNTSTLSLLFNLAFGLVFVLGIQPFSPSFTGYGFVACPIVTSTVAYVGVFILWYVYIYRQQLHATCWDGWSFQEITWARIKTFSELYFPSALSLASDFWRMAVIGGVAAKLGEEEVAVFNTSYRIIWMVLILVGALSGASGINMTIRLGQMNPNGAKQAGYVGIAMSAVVVIMVGIAIFLNIRLFGRIFTNDTIFLDMFESARIPFIATLVFMSISLAVERIPYSMGRTKEVFWIGLIASWGGQVPAVILCTTLWRADLVALYTGTAVGYVVLLILYSYVVYKSDWRRYAEDARLRSESLEPS